MRRQRQRPPVGGGGVGEPAGGVQRVGPAAVPQRVPRLPPGRRVEMPDGLRGPALGEQHFRQLPRGAGRVRVQRQRTAEAGLGGGGVAAPPLGRRQVVVERGPVRGQLRRPPQPGRGRLDGPGLKLDEAEEVQRVGVLRVGRQDAAVQRLRLRGPAGPVERHGLGEPLV